MCIRDRYAKAHKDDSGELIYEHLRYRLKSEKSMQSKLEVRGLPLTPYSVSYTHLDVYKRQQVGGERILRCAGKPSLRNSANCMRNLGRRMAPGQ